MAELMIVATRAATTMMVSNLEHKTNISAAVESFLQQPTDAESKTSVNSRRIESQPVCVHMTSLI